MDRRASLAAGTSAATWPPITATPMDRLIAGELRPTPPDIRDEHGKPYEIKESGYFANGQPWFVAPQLVDAIHSAYDRLPSTSD